MDKEKIINNKVFCMFPWTHLNVTPMGHVFPCCTNDYQDPVGSTKVSSLNDIINNQRMKQLRLNMLNGVQSKDCRFCYEHEKVSPWSFRSFANSNFLKHYDDLVPQTKEDGSIENFQMKYIDVRFSNICNFKCRTCGSLFSSQWAKEDKNIGTGKFITLHANPEGKLLEELLTHLDHVEMLYFGGGEPLLMDEHYIILEELIRKNKCDIKLRYNTNCSTLKYKTKDILSLWKNFKNVEISASLDHYGERAEYIRNGTNWGEVESNILLFRSQPNIDFTINTVLSVFNYLTLNEFYSYLVEKNILYKNDQRHTLYQLLYQKWQSAKILPTELKLVGNEKNKQLVSYFENNGYDYTSKTMIKNAIEFVNQDNWWEENKLEFQTQVSSKDKIRNEDFIKTFPELRSMFDAN